MPDNRCPAHPRQRPELLVRRLRRRQAAALAAGRLGRGGGGLGRGLALGLQKLPHALVLWQRNDMASENMEEQVCNTHTLHCSHGWTLPSPCFRLAIAHMCRPAHSCPIKPQPAAYLRCRKVGRQVALPVRQPSIALGAQQRLGAAGAAAQGRAVQRRRALAVAALCSVGHDGAGGQGSQGSGAANIHSRMAG